MKIQKLLTPWPPKWKCAHERSLSEPKYPQDEILSNAILKEVQYFENYEAINLRVIWDKRNYTADCEWVQGLPSLYIDETVKLLKTHQGKATREIGEFEVEPAISVIH